MVFIYTMKNYLRKFGAWLSVLPLLLLPASAHAQLSDAQASLETIGGSLGDDLGSQSLEQLIASIIQVLLSVLGIIFLILTIYAGFLYLTSQGDKDKAGKAIKLLTQAVIGLVIIIAAYAISAFVIEALVGVAGGTV